MPRRAALHPADPSRPSVCDDLAGRIQAVGFEEAEAPVEQRQAIGGALFFGAVAHHHRDQALIAALGRAQQAVAGFGSVTGLDAVHRRVAPQQPVTVALLDGADLEFLDLVVGVGLRVIAHHRAAQQGQVVGGGVMPFGAQSVRVDEVRILHADLGGVAVHQRGEGFFAAGHVLGQRDGGIVAGLDRHALSMSSRRAVWLTGKPL